MAAGDFYIRKNVSEADIIGDLGTLDAGWDTLVHDEGSIVAYTDPNFQLDIGFYLIMYSEHFISDSTTNNERIEIQGEIQVSSSPVGGYGQDYIRKSSGVGQDCTVSGQMILEITADNTDVKIHFYRSDTSQDATGVHRVGGHGGVTILELSSSDNFGFYSNSAAQTLSGATEVDMVLNTNDQQDTGFSRTANAVTISTAGRYLAMYSSRVHQTGTGREDYSMHLEIGTTKIAGTSSYAYLRGDSDENCDDGACTWIGIIDVSASDVITLRGISPSTSLPGSILAGTLSLQFWQIPSGGDEAIIEATSGDFNADAVFSWDTQPHLDAASFTYTNGQSNIDIDQDDHVLVFATVFNELADTPQRAIPRLSLLKDGDLIDHATASVYHRNSASDGVSVNIATIIPNCPSGTEIEMRTDPLETTGALTNDSGQFSFLSLESLYGYTYIFPPTITDVDTDEVIGNTQTNVVITGTYFEAIKGTGKVELGPNFDYSGTKILQSTDSWADLSIQFDVTAGVLADTHCFLFVTNDTGSRAVIAVQVGLPPETYQEAQEALTPTFQHYWTFQNTYDDEVGTATANNGSGGTPTFPTTPIVKGDTHSLLINSTTEYISPADQTDMNTSSIATRRMMSGWIMVTDTIQAVSVIWEEGAQVNNYAWLIGFGNNLMIQFADDGGDYVQIYFPVTLTPNRPYHVYMEFNASGVNSGICRGLLDGVPNVESNGNPWTVAAFPSHSGNISWGHEGTENLQVGDSRTTDNVDIAFASPVACHYAHFISMQQNEYTTAQIREEMFEKGAIATETITADTEANMQTDIDTHADTLFTDAPCSIEVAVCDDGDFELVLDNITFEDRVSMQIRYLGADTLTLVMENGTVLDTDKLGAPYGGTITVINAPAITITVKDIDTGSVIQNARVRLLADAGGDLTEGDVILTGLTDVLGQITTNLRYTSDQPMAGWVRKSTTGTLYKEGSISATSTSSGLDITIFMIKDE